MKKNIFGHFIVFRGWKRNIRKVKNVSAHKMYFRILINIFSEYFPTYTTNVTNIQMETAFPHEKVLFRVTNNLNT